MQTLVVLEYVNLGLSQSVFVVTPAKQTSANKLFCPMGKPNNIPLSTSTGLPPFATYVAELTSAAASYSTSQPSADASHPQQRHCTYLCGCSRLPARPGSDNHSIAASHCFWLRPEALSWPDRQGTDLRVSHLCRWCMSTAGTRSSIRAATQFPSEE